MLFSIPMKKKQITRRDAELLIYEKWQRNRLPEYFTNEHPQYEKAVSLIIEKGDITTSDVEMLTRNSAEVS